VMGGADTEINDQTRDVLIERVLQPRSIRHTARALGMTPKPVQVRLG
jgi:phenylalanyl-tRNA synthetase beta subunit